jgi:hypothetical protein
MESDLLTRRLELTNKHNLHRLHDALFIYVFRQRNAIAVVAQNWMDGGWISANDTRAGGHWGSGPKLNASAIFSEKEGGGQKMEED